MRNYNSTLHPRISLELSQDISDSAARSSPPLSTYEDQNGGHGNRCLQSMEER